MGRLFRILWIISILTILDSPSWSYQEIEVQNGGTLQGRTVLINQIPQPRVYHLILFPNVDMCAGVDTDDELNRLLYDFIIDDNGGLKDVVVSLKHVEAGKPFEQETVRIRAETCKFFPDVNVVRQGATFTVDNMDAVMHNSQVYQKERGKIITNLPVPPEEITDGTVTFQKHYKIFQMICGMHEFMQTWGYRVQNPYYFITGIDGNFQIDNIPPGDYVVHVWHYLMKPKKRKIHVAENGVIDLNFELNGSKITRPLYETIKSGRIKKDAAAPGTAKGREVGK